MIKTTGYDQHKIIKDILKLHVPSGIIDCDPTYGRGNFYKKGISPPKLKFDIKPINNTIVKASSDNLPIKDGSLNCIMFDPPFLATTGKSLNSPGIKNNVINKRFGVLKTEKDLYSFYTHSLIEFYRVLLPKGVLIFKCQDKVSSGKQYFSHVFVMNEAVNAGFYPKDLFVLVAKNRLVANWQKKNQKHARKYHAYFWVFEKN